MNSGDWLDNEEMAKYEAEKRENLVSMEKLRIGAGEIGDLLHGADAVGVNQRVFEGIEVSEDGTIALDFELEENEKPYELSNRLDKERQERRASFHEQAEKMGVALDDLVSID